MAITKKPFGTTKAGEAVVIYTLKNAAEAYAEIITYGGAIRALGMPDKNGVIGDVALGYDSIGDYEQQGGYLGALIGRIGNRIEGGVFTLNGKEYQLDCNDGRNHLHGGETGFDKKMWSARELDDDALELTCTSPDGEEGYPGTLSVTVVYRLSEDNALSIDYTAQSNADTIINLTNHCYFNLACSGDILGHELKLNCPQYCENSAECLPTGVLGEVQGTPFDFLQPHTIGERIDDDNEQLHNCGGYDHNFAIAHSGDGLVFAAELYDPASGRVMETLTTKPGVQLYTGNGLNEAHPAKGGGHYKKRAGLCLETQFYPNAMKHTHFPSPVLRAGEAYHHTTVYRFTTR